MAQARQTTLLDLICRIQDEVRDDREVVKIVSALINSGAVTLCGNFRGTRFVRL